MSGILFQARAVQPTTAVARLADMAPIGPAERDDIRRALRSLRQHLQMDVAFISRFVGDHRVLVEVDTELADPPVAVGMAIPMSEGYCQRIVDGRLPYIIADTAALPEAMALPATREMPIGSHLSVPLICSDGKLYGTFCCFGLERDPFLHDRDLSILRAVAELTMHFIEKQEAEQRLSALKRDRVQAILDAGGPTIVYQPIVLLADMRVIGVEALSRFNAEPRRAPDQWFAEAGEVGLKSELERAAIRNAIAQWRSIWKQSRLHLSLNCSAETMIEGRLEELLDGAPIDLIVLELTEHDDVDDYDMLNRALEPLRARGLRVAIDDAGSGYASMRHILNVRPDIIKLDVSLTRNIDSDGMRRSLARALVSFAEGFEGNVVAEGVEKEADLDALRILGVRAAQGYHIARPLSLASFRQFLFRR